MNDNLTDVAWRRLLRSIRDGTCVLFLGPDASVVDGAGQPLGNQLATVLSEESDSDLHWAAQTFSGERADEFDLIDKAELFFKPYADSTTSMHRDLAALPFELVIQTSADRFMANALAEQEQKNPIEAYFHIRSGVRYLNDPQLAPGREPSVGSPLVFGLHGSAEDGMSLVLTENDVLEFLVRLIRDKSTLPAYLLRRVRLATTCLFIGFGFHRWYQRLMLYVLRGAVSGSRWRSLALEVNSFFALPDSRQTVTYYDKEHRIDFTGLSFAEFAQKLRQSYEKEVADLPALPEPGHVEHPSGPKVFLSYSNGDAADVQRLAEELQNRGISTWRDKDDIRGGEDWEHRARHVLREVVDYVAVLHSGNLSSGESWMRYEINTALERRKKMPPGVAFVIPCHFLGCERMEEDLKDLHYVSVPSPSECDALAKAILDDWALRQQKAIGYAEGS